MKKHIYIFSPSGAVRDKVAFRRGIKRLQAMGHEVEVDEAALASHQRFAGNDEMRLAAVHRAAASGADLALVSRGGYGLTRLLGRIRYPAVAKAIERGTRFVGLSDFTAFQLAVLARSGQVTWAGPSLVEGLGAPEPDEIMLACLDDLLSGQGEGTGWHWPTADFRSATKKEATLIDPAKGKPSFLRKRGVLWGGNLAVLCSLMGTPYLPKIEGGLLFLEDVAEHPYRIERMLTQLLHAGILGRQKAILLGHFTDYRLTPHDRGFKLQSVVDWLRTQVKVPVLTGLPFGHVPTKVLLPVGARCELLVEAQDALLLWGDIT